MVRRDYYGNRYRTVSPWTVVLAGLASAAGFIGLMVGIMLAHERGHVFREDWTGVQSSATGLLLLVAVVVALVLPWVLLWRYEYFQWPFDGSYKGGKAMKGSEALRSAAACIVAGLAWLVGGVMGMAWWHVAVLVCAVAVVVYSVLAHVRLAQARRALRKARRKVKGLKAGGTA